MKEIHMHITTRFMVTISIWALFVTFSFAGQLKPQPSNTPTNYLVMYHDEFKDSYWIPTSKTTIDGPLDPKVVSKSPYSDWRVEILRTDGTKIPYEKEVGLLQVYDNDGKRQGGLITRGFRVINTQWVDDRRLFISINVGHVAQVITLYDVTCDVIICQKSVSYELQIQQ
jgi:hypothetical protein